MLSAWYMQIADVDKMFRAFNATPAPIVIGYLSAPKNWTMADTYVLSLQRSPAKTWSKAVAPVRTVSGTEDHIFMTGYGPTWASALSALRSAKGDNQWLDAFAKIAERLIHK